MSAIDSKLAHRRVGCATHAAIRTARLVLGVPDSRVEVGSSHAPFEVVRPVNCYRSRSQASVSLRQWPCTIASPTIVALNSVGAGGLPHHRRWAETSVDVAPVAMSESPMFTEAFRLFLSKVPSNTSLERT